MQDQRILEKELYVSCRGFSDNDMDVFKNFTMANKNHENTCKKSWEIKSKETGENSNSFKDSK